jgi:transglutaminase-like putative cysteine protease
MVAGRPTVRYQALIALLAAFLISSLIGSLNGFWHLGGGQGQLLLFSIVAAGFGWIWWRSPLTGLGILVLGCAGLLGGVWLGYLPRASAFLQAAVLQAYDFSDSLRTNMLEATFGPALGTLFLFGTALLTGLVVVPESLTKGSTFWTIAAGTLIFGTEWAWYYDAAALHFTAFCMLAFIMWTLGQAAVRDAHWEGAGRKVGYRSHVVTPVVWVLVVGILATVMPSEFNPVDLGAWGDRAQEAFPVLKKLRGAGVGGGGRFSLRSTGFTPDMGVWGGPVKLDHTVALSLTLDKPLTETAYLRGATFLTYDGRAWQPGKSEELKLEQDATLPTSMGADVLRDYTTITVKPAGYAGFTLFNFWEPMQVKGVKSGYKADADGNLWANKQVTKGSTYEVSARLPRYSAEQVRKLGSAPAGSAQAPYLQLPDTTPQAVAAAAKALTEQQPTPYDKAVAIERYLRTLPYELDVPATPPGRDFVEYFLFDLKRGYCVYSAAAMAVMLREVDIPSRVVVGFAVPATSQSTEGSDGKITYSVLNSQAHAWVEAYFPGYGWVTFDPTPRSDLPVIDRSLPAPVETDATEKPSGGSGATPQTPTDDSENFQEGAGRGLTESADFTPGGAVKRDWPWAAGVVALVGAVLYLAYRRLQARERITARESRELVQEVWTKTGSLLRQFDAGPKPYQTPHEYAQTLGTRWPAIKEPAEGVAREYTEVRYGPPGRAVGDQVSEDAKSLWEKVHELLFERFGWRTYFWRRLRWKYRD